MHLSLPVPARMRVLLLLLPVLLGLAAPGLHAQSRAPAPGPVCEPPPEGETLGLCLQDHELRAERARQARIAQLTRGLPAAPRAALESLQRAAEAFAGQREQSETDMSTPLRAATAVRARAAELDQLLQDLDGLEQARGRLAPTPLDADEAGRRLDAMLHTLLRSTSASGDLLGYTTVRKAGVLGTQQAWLRMREAWLAYGAARYPGFDARAWWTVLTLRRGAQLKTLNDHAQP
jgi:hypothetical protein